MFLVVGSYFLCSGFYEMNKHKRRFPIGTMVKFQKVVSLEVRYGLVISYVAMAMYSDGTQIMGLNIYTDGKFQYINPNRCRPLSRPYIKQKDINLGKSG